MYSRKLHQTPSVVFFLPCSTSLRSCRSFNSGNYELLDAAGNGTDCIVLYRQRVEEEQQHVVVFIDIIYGASCSSSKEFITLSAVCHHHQHFGGGGGKTCARISIWVAPVIDFSCYARLCLPEKNKFMRNLFICRHLFFCITRRCTVD